MGPHWLAAPPPFVTPWMQARRLPKLKRSASPASLRQVRAHPPDGAHRMHDTRLGMREAWGWQPMAPWARRRSIGMLKEGRGLLVCWHVSAWLIWPRSSRAHTGKGAGEDERNGGDGTSWAGSSGPPWTSLDAGEAAARAEEEREPSEPATGARTRPTAHTVCTTRGYACVKREAGSRWHNGRGGAASGCRKRGGRCSCAGM